MTVLLSEKNQPKDTLRFTVNVVNVLAVICAVTFVVTMHWRDAIVVMVLPMLLNILLQVRNHLAVMAQESKKQTLFLKSLRDLQQTKVQEAHVTAEAAD